MLSALQAGENTSTARRSGEWKTLEVEAEDHLRRIIESLLQPICSVIPSQSSNGSFATSPSAASKSNPYDVFLPRPQLVCLSPFRICCDRLEPRLKDWNEEFQQLWELECRPVFDIEHRMELRRFVKAFDEHSSAVVRHIMDQPEGGGQPKGLKPFKQFPQCYRIGNLFVRKWTDPQLGRNVQRAFCALMQAKVPGLHFPLTSCCSYFGTVVTVMAFIPVNRDSRRLYRGDGIADEKLFRHAHQLVLKLLNALNLEPHVITGSGHSQPGGSSAGGGSHYHQNQQQQAKQLGLELYEGLDARIYVTNALGLLPPLRPGDTRTGPQVRLKLLHGTRSLVGFTKPFVDAVRVNIRRAARYFVATVEELRVGAPSRVPEGLVSDVMHACGLNMSLLFLFALEVQAAAVETDASDTALQLVCLDILARTFRDQIFLAGHQEQSTPFISTPLTHHESSSTTVGMANMLLARAVGSMLTQDGFEANILPAVLRKFRHAPPTTVTTMPTTEEDLTGAEEASHRRMSVVAATELTYRQVVATLRSTVEKNDRSKLTRRISALCGLVVSRGIVEGINVLDSKHNFSHLLNAEQDMQVSAFVNECSPSNVTGEYFTAFVQPRRAETLCRMGNLNEAMVSVRQSASVWKRCGRHFLYFDALIDCAMVAIAAADFEAAEPLLFRVREAFARYEQDYQLQPSSEPTSTTTSASSTAAAGAGGLRLEFSVQRQRILCRMLFAHLKCRQELHREAKNAFVEALELCGRLPSECQRCVAPLKLAAYAGLLEVSSSAPIVDLAALHEDITTLTSNMHPTKFVFSVMSRFGLQLLEYGYPMLATTTLTATRTVCERVYGAESSEMTHILTSLAFAFFRWNVDKYGDEALTMLDEANVLTEQLAGQRSVAHLVSISNLAIVAIAKKQYTRASRLLHSVLSRRKQLKEIPVNHPAFEALLRARETLRRNFMSEATVLIQHAWGRYAERKRVKVFLDAAASVVQRVGRGYVSRALTAKEGACDEHWFRQREQNPIAMCFSRPLLLAATRYSATEPEYNIEYQLCVEEGLISAASDDRRAAITADFVEAARRCILAIERSPRTGLLDGSKDAYQFGNVVVTKWAWDEINVLAHYYHTQLLLDARLPMVKVPLTALLEGQDRSLYLAQAVFPVPRERCTLWEEDGSVPTSTNPVVDSILTEWLTTANIQRPQIGFQIVKGADGFWYVTNAVTLGNYLMESSSSLIAEGSVHFSRSVRPVRTSPKERDGGDLDVQRGSLVGESSSSWYAQLAAKYASGDIEGTTSMAEARVLSHTAIPHEYVLALESLAAVYSASSKLPVASSTWRQVCKLCEGNPSIWGPHTVRVLEALGSSLSRQTLFPAAYECFSRAIALADGMPLHQRHGVPVLAKCIVGLVRCAQRGATAWPTLSAEIDGVLKLGRPCQPLLALATTLAHHESSLGNVASALSYLDHAFRIARILHGESSLQVVSVLEQQSKVLFAKKSKSCLAQSRVCLEQAVEIVSRLDAKSMRMSLLLNNLGCTCLALHDYRGAQGHFLAAKELIESRAVSSNDLTLELVHLQKNMKVVEMRIQLRCVMRVQAAVRAWKAKRHALDQLKLEDPERYQQAMAERALARIDTLLRLEMVGRLKVAHLRDDELRSLDKMHFLATLRLLDRTRHGAAFAAARSLMQEKERCATELLLEHTKVAAEPADRGAISLAESIKRIESVAAFAGQWHSATKYKLLVRHIEFLDHARVAFLVDEEAAARRELIRTRGHGFQAKALRVLESLGRRHVVHLRARDHFAFSELAAAGWNIEKMQRRHQDRLRQQANGASPPSPKRAGGGSGEVWSIFVDHATTSSDVPPVADGSAAQSPSCDASSSSSHAVDPIAEEPGKAPQEGCNRDDLDREGSSGRSEDCREDVENTAGSLTDHEKEEVEEDEEGTTSVFDAISDNVAETCNEPGEKMPTDPLPQEEATPLTSAHRGDDPAPAAILERIHPLAHTSEKSPASVFTPADDGHHNDNEDVFDVDNDNSVENDAHHTQNQVAPTRSASYDEDDLSSDSTGSERKVEEEGDKPCSPVNADGLSPQVFPSQIAEAALAQQTINDREAILQEMAGVAIAAERELGSTIPEFEAEARQHLLSTAQAALTFLREEGHKAAIGRCIDAATRTIEIDLPLLEAAVRADIRESFLHQYSLLLRNLLATLSSPPRMERQTAEFDSASQQVLGSSPAGDAPKRSAETPGSERRRSAGGGRRIKHDVISAREAQERTSVAKHEAATFSTIVRHAKAELMKLFAVQQQHQHMPAYKPSRPTENVTRRPVVQKRKMMKAPKGGEAIDENEEMMLGGGGEAEAFLSICQRTGRPLLGGFPVDARAAAVMRIDRQLRNFKASLLRAGDALLREFEEVVSDGV